MRDIHPNEIDDCIDNHSFTSYLIIKKDGSKPFWINEEDLDNRIMVIL